MLIYTLIGIAIFFLIYPYLKKAVALKRWRNALHLPEHQLMFQHIINDIDGFSLSQRARTQADAMEYTYGEIDFVSFIALIGMTHPAAETRFYDLGSGTGKAVLACAMVFEMQAYCGIELFNELHQAALIQQQRLQRLPAYRHKAIHFIQDNFLNADFSDATLIFINATALFGPTWDQLNQRLTEETAVGTIIITTSKPLIASPAYVLDKKTSVMMSWGISTVYIQRKCGDSCFKT